MDPHTEHSDDLSSKFENFEHTPADHVWRRVQIEVEGDARPGTMAAHLGSYTHTPNPQVWDRIAHEVSPMRRRAAFFWWAATAASVAMLLFVGWQFGAKKSVEPASNPAGWSAHSPIDTSDASNSGNFISKDGSEGRNGLAEATDNSGIERRSLQDQGLSALLFASVDDDYQYENQSPEESLEQNEAFPIRRKPLWATGQLPSRDEIITLPIFAKSERTDSVDLQQWADILRREREDDFSPTYAADFNSGFSRSVSIRKAFTDLSLLDGGFTTTSGVVEQSSPSPGRLDEDFNTPLVLGAQLRRSTGKRTSIGFGPVYTLITSTKTISRSASRIQQNRRRQYLGLALNGNYAILQKRRFSAYVSTGVQFDFGLNFRTETVTTVATGTVSNEVDRSALGSLALANFGGGIDLHVTQQMGIYMQGSMRRAFFNTHSTLWTQQPWWPGIQVGLRLSL